MDEAGSLSALVVDFSFGGLNPYFWRICWCFELCLISLIFASMDLPFPCIGGSPDEVVSEVTVGVALEGGMTSLYVGGIALLFPFSTTMSRG